MEDLIYLVGVFYSADPEPGDCNDQDEDQEFLEIVTNDLAEAEAKYEELAAKKDRKWFFGSQYAYLVEAKAGAPRSEWRQLRGSGKVL